MIMITGATLIFIAIAILVVVIVLSGVKIVQQSETVVVERLGRYDRTLTSGINIIWPVIDKPREITWRQIITGYNGEKTAVFRKRQRIDLREAVYDFPKQNVITKDNVVTEINAMIYFQIIDPVKALYEIENLPLAIEMLTQTTLRNVIGELDLDQTLTSRDTINSKLRTILDEATDKWGVKINRVELQDINPPKDIRDAMEKQMRAERDRRAKILEAEGLKGAQILEAEGVREAQVQRAEGHKLAQILTAEGQAESRIKVAQAESEAIRLVTEAISKTGDPVNYLVAMRYLDTLKEMTSGKDNKVVYMPYEATGVLSSVGGIKDMLTGVTKK
ncbi:MAG: SPFH/Band 7/PHB domain protein [Prevotellaceae bacterium]|jgi:regulator of protease activity HflC (stomatin/prohibitin superfamily)|nr:SPFH/Band 7/PHB domain protein [Prevotellaceae bacterium]